MSNLVDSPAEGILKIKCNYRHDNKNVKNASLNTSIISTLNIQMLKMIFLIFKCLCCNSNYQKKYDGDFADEAICY